VVHLAIVIDCTTREVIEWRLAQPGNTATTEAALEEVLIFQFGRVPGKIGA